MPVIINGNGTVDTGTVLVGNSDITGLAAGALPANVIGAGAVLQVVNANTATQASASTTTYADTNLTATITPTSATSRILVLVSQNGVYKTSFNSGNGVNLRLVKNSTALITFVFGGTYTGTNFENTQAASTCYLDSPATTSATTYKTQLAAYNNAAAVYAQAFNETSTITLLEIAG